MKKLLYTTTAFVLCGGIVQANAACIATPSCDTLGYTSSTSCTNGIKCPFGNKWFCSSSRSQEIADLCLEMGYKYTCTGTGFAGSVGGSCNGKYQECACKDGYNLVNGACSPVWKACAGLAANCKLGDILFSDGTCNANTVSGKTPIAVVVYKSGSCGQAMALKSIGKYMWGDYRIDISTLPNLSDSEASQDYASCENSKKIMAAGNKSTYPAAWAAREYKTEGTEAGDWCLPAAGIFTSYYNNQDAINSGFTKAGGTKFTNSTFAWSSSEYSNSSGAWKSYFSRLYGLISGSYTKDESREVYPVIEF